MKASGSLLFKSLKGLVDITVETIAERDGLLTYRRRWGMVVAVSDDGENNGRYGLEKGKNSDILGDNDNWEKLSTDPYTHPTGFTNQPSEELAGMSVISQVEVSDEGHVSGTKQRELPHRQVGLREVNLKTLFSPDIISFDSDVTLLVIGAHANNYIRIDNAADVVVTVPAHTDELPVKTIITFFQGGAGRVIMAAASGVTLNAYGVGAGQLPATAGQFAGLQIIKVDENEWDVIGHIAIDE